MTQENRGNIINYYDYMETEEYDFMLEQFENMQVMLDETEISDDEKYVYCDDDEIRFLSRDE